MATLSATSHLTGFLTLYYLILTARVIRLRFKYGISLGDGSLQFLLSQVLPAIVKVDQQNINDKSILKDNKYVSLQKAIRAHNNLSEFGPWMIILFGLCEWQSMISSYWLHHLAALFLVARILHVEAGITTKSSVGIGRSLGMAVTLSLMGILAIALLLPTINTWININSWFPRIFVE